MTIEVSKMIRTVKGKSRRHDLAEGDLRNAIEETMESSHDLWDVCCGHDLVCILSLGLRSALGSNRANDVKPELLQKSLRLAYGPSFFFRTELSRSLRAWEAANQPFRIFSSA